MIDLGATFFFQLINFIVLYLILRYFLFDPVSNFMNNRSEDISDKIENAKDREKEAKKLKEDLEKKLYDAKQEAQEIRDNARREGDSEKEDIVNQAKEEANRKIAKADDEISRAKKQAMKSLNDEVATLAVEGTRRILEQSITEKNQVDMINNIINELDEEKLGEIKC